MVRAEVGEIELKLESSTEVGKFKLNLERLKEVGKLNWCDFKLGFWLLQIRVRVASKLKLG